MNKQLLALTMTCSLALPIYGQTVSSLGKGECLAVLNSKVYTHLDVQSPYPKTTRFFCQYQCLNELNQIEEIQGHHEVITHNIEADATDVVCEGTKLKKVAWGWDFDKIIPFYAFASKSKTIKEFAHYKMERNSQIEKVKGAELKNNLSSIILSYENTKVPTFVEAAIILKEIQKDLPLVNETFDMWLKEAANQGKATLSIQTKDLVINTLLTHAYWLLPL